MSIVFRIGELDFLIWDLLFIYDLSNLVEFLFFVVEDYDWMFLVFFDQGSCFKDHYWLVKAVFEEDLIGVFGLVDRKV